MSKLFPYLTDDTVALCCSDYLRKIVDLREAGISIDLPEGIRDLKEELMAELDHFKGVQTIEQLKKEKRVRKHYSNK